MSSARANEFSVDNLEEETADELVQLIIGVEEPIENFSLKSASKIPSDLATKLVEALEKNGSITEFILKPCKDPDINSRIDHCLQRNRSIAKAAVILFNETIQACLHEPTLDLHERLLLKKQLEQDFSGKNYNDISTALYDLMQAAVDSTILGILTKTFFLLEKLHEYCLEANSTALIAISSLGLVQHIESLCDTSEAIHATNIQGETALHVAAFFGHINTIELLCKLGANIDARTPSGDTALDLAICGGNKEAVALLIKRLQNTPDAEQVAPGYPEKYSAIKRIHNTFGGHKVAKPIKAIGRTFSNGGHTVNEGYNAIIDYFTRYINTHKEESDPRLLKTLNYLKSALKNTTSSLDAASLKQEFEEADPGYKKIIVLQIIGHHIGMTLKKEENQDVSLVLADRGFYSNRFLRISGSKKINCVMSVRVSPPHLEEVINKLCDANFSTITVAADILFNEIPGLVDKAYEPNRHIRQSLFKSGICYIGNAKSIFLEDLVDRLGPTEGNEVYKKVTLFMREQAAQDYQKLFGNDRLFQKSVEIIDLKKIKVERDATIQALRGLKNDFDFAINTRVDYTPSDEQKIDIINNLYSDLLKNSSRLTFQDLKVFVGCIVASFNESCKEISLFKKSAFAEVINTFSKTHLNLEEDEKKSCLEAYEMAQGITPSQNANHR